MNKNITVCFNFFLSLNLISISSAKSFLERIHTSFFNYVVKFELEQEIKIKSAVNINKIIYQTYSTYFMF